MIGRFLILVLAMGLSVGCGDGGPKTYTVVGTVTYSGKPLETGTISFEDATAGAANSATIGKGGKYSLELPKGSYKVTLLPATEERVSEDGTKVEAMVDEKMFPRKYRTASTSGLSLEVSANSTLDVGMK
jgi:hypothetical protein